MGDHLHRPQPRETHGVREANNYILVSSASKMPSKAVTQTRS